MEKYATGAMRAKNPTASHPGKKRKQKPKRNAIITNTNRTVRALACLFFFLAAGMGVFLSLGACTKATPEGAGVVQRVLDGDTVILTNGAIVRYLGIDAPEKGRDQVPDEPFALASLEMNRRLVSKKSLALETDLEAKDRYGRTLAYAFLPEGLFVNEEMLRAGLAWCLPTAKNFRYRERLLSAQRSAIQKGRGVFQGLLDKKPEPLLGNRRSLRFHRTTCLFGRQTAPFNRIRFSGYSEAFQAGFAPCSRCLADWPSP